MLSSLTISTTLQITNLKEMDYFNVLTEIIWNSISLKFCSFFSTPVSIKNSNIGKENNLIKTFSLHNFSFKNL